MNTYKILLVDDDKIIHDLYDSLFEETEFIIDHATNAMSALEKFTSEIDLVIADIQMPGRDGIWLLTEILNVNPKCPVIMITGGANEETIQEAMKLGAQTVILKDTVRKNEFIQLVRQSVRCKP